MTNDLSSTERKNTVTPFGFRPACPYLSLRFLDRETERERERDLEKDRERDLDPDLEREERDPDFDLLVLDIFASTCQLYLKETGKEKYLKNEVMRQI